MFRNVFERCLYAVCCLPGGFFSLFCNGNDDSIFVKDPDAELDPEEVVVISQDEASKAAEEAFRKVLEYGPQIELDHYLVY